MADDLYDEFGNYIGPELDDDSSDDDESSSSSQSGSEAAAGDGDHGNEDDEGMSLDDDDNVAGGDDRHTNVSASAIVLHEDKEHYGQVYNESVKTVTLTEDAETIETPIVPRPSVRPEVLLEDMTMKEEDGAETDFFGTLLRNPRLKRFIGVVGEFHSGKTSLMDLLIEDSVRYYHSDNKEKKNSAIMKGCWGEQASLEACHGGGPRLMDSLKIEKERQMSIKTCPMCMMLPDSRGKSYLMNFLDTPGHVQFVDEEVTCATALTDGCMVVIDPLEPSNGVSLERILPKLIAAKQEMILCLNKMDRLLLEVKLPPADAYWKLKRVIEEVNALVEDYSGIQDYFHPVRNVIFSSALHGYMFTLDSFTKIYFEGTQVGPNDMDAQKFKLRLWGDSYFCQQERTFYKTSKEVKQGTKQRSFVEFVLSPLYKLYSVCLGEEQKVLDKTLRNLPVPILLPKQTLKSSAKTILRSVLSSYFGSLAIVDTLQKLPSPAFGWKRKSKMISNSPVYTGSSMRPLNPAFKKCVVHVTKLVDIQGKFGALCRVYSGELKVGDRVKVLGNAYPADLEDVTFHEISSIHIPTFSVNLESDTVKLAFRSQKEVNGGNIVILHGIDANISHSATAVGSTKKNKIDEDDDDEEEEEEICFKPLRFDESVVKLSIEPLRPAELPKMVQGLRSVLKSYPACHLLVQDTGEHCLFGTGELYLETVMECLRSYSDVEIKVAEPTVALRESVSSTSIMGVVGETPNHRNKLTITVSPLEPNISEALLENNLPTNPDAVSNHFMKEYGWDLLSSRSIWAFEYERASLLLDDTIPDFNENDYKANLEAAKAGIVQGFRWAAKEGPLCEEPLHGCKVKLLDAILAPSAVHRSSGQIIPTVRRTVHAGILLANPVLLEPVNKLHITTPTSIVDSLVPVLSKRRGMMTSDTPIGASTYSIVTAYIPVLDSFGFESDIRTYTQGQAMVYSSFEYWNEVPGEAMDTSIVLHPLEPSPPQSLARELLVKTRRRKGLSEEVSVNKYLDDEMKRQLLLAQRGDEDDSVFTDDGEDKKIL